MIKPKAKTSILFISSEASPFAKVGGLADVVGTLPGVLNSKGCDARVVMPFYKIIKDNYHDRAKFHTQITIKMGWRNQYCGLYSYVSNGVVFYFIDNEFYFGHDKIYIDYGFDIERFSFFQRAVLQLLGESMDFVPDILHCNDWQAGMIPCLLKAHYQASGLFKKIRTVMTIHNIKYQGISSAGVISDLMDLSMDYMNDYGVIHAGAANFLKAGIVYSDAITTVSPTYAKEMLTSEYGEGLELVLKYYENKITGILNGIDYAEFNPLTDKYIAANYDISTFSEAKLHCKHELRKELGLRTKINAPLVAMVTRLVDQKGLDLLLAGFDEIIEMKMQLVVLGTGDPYYEKALEELAVKHSGWAACEILFDNVLAHRIYAAADIFLMPSLFEPCGLSQIISMRYGTVPVVRETGGLIDTVSPYNQYTGEGTGFSFANPKSEEMVAALRYAADIFKNRKDAWDWLIRSGMSKDFSWAESARSYIGIYSTLCNAT